MVYITVNIHTAKKFPQPNQFDKQMHYCHICKLVKPQKTMQLNNKILLKKNTTALNLIIARVRVALEVAIMH